MNSWKFTRSLPILAVLLSASTFCATRVRAQSQSLVSINSYAQQVDQFSKRHKKRVFANVASETDEADHWREFKTAAELKNSDEPIDESAHVWQKSGKVVAAHFNFSSQSGDWAQDVNYYFREDGTLAKIHSRLNTFHGNLSVIREKFYDASGKTLRTSTKYLDLSSQKPSRSRDFMDQEIPLYLKARDLPFYKLL